MFPAEEVSQTTEALEKLSQTTEALEKLPRTFDHRSALNERRQQILQQKQSDKNTDTLPSLGPETPGAKLAWRQVAQLREENRRLRASLEELRESLKQLGNEKAQIQSRFEEEIAIIHNGNQQDIAHYQTHLLELMDERNRLHDEYAALKSVQHDFAQRFEQSVDEEIQQRLNALAQTLDGMDVDVETPAPLLRFVQSVELRARSEGDRYLAEAVHLKREMKRLTDTLAEERQRLDEERRQLAILQQSASQQAHLRQKLLDDRFRARWKTVALSTSAGLLVLLVVSQFAFLALLHVALGGMIALAMLLPMLLCALLAAVMVSPPMRFLKHVRESVPRRKKSVAPSTLDRV